MPAPPLDVNWEAVKAHAIIHGIRPTAEHYGIAPGTLTSRSCREGWLLPAAPKTVPATMQPKAVNAAKPAEAALNAVSGYSSRSKIGLAKAISKGSTKLGRMKAEDILARTGPLKDLASAGKTVFSDWQGDAPALVNIVIGPAAAPAPAVDIDVTKL